MDNDTPGMVFLHISPEVAERLNRYYINDWQGVPPVIRSDDEKGNPMDTNAQVLHQLEETLRVLRKSRPNERSERSRAYAVCITLMEQAVSYFYYMLVKDST